MNLEVRYLGIYCTYRVTIFGVTMYNIPDLVLKESNN